MINTKEQAVYVRLKAKYIGREKKEKNNKYILLFA